MSGILRLKNHWEDPRPLFLCKAENAPYPRIEFTDTHFYIVFNQSREYLQIAERTKVAEKLGERLGKKLGENQIKIIKLIKENRYITTRELSGKIGISTTAIDKNIAKLKQKGLLRRIGPAKGGWWEIMTDVES